MIVTRLATPSDAGVVAARISEGFETYRAWAPADWTPPVVGEGDPKRFAGALARPDVWFLVAVSDGAVIGHVALSLSTREDPGPPPPGTVFVWELFVRPAWHGHGVGTMLMRAAVTEALKRGFSGMRLWTPEGAGRARGFYERQGWALTGRVHRPPTSGLRRSNTAVGFLERWIGAARCIDRSDGPRRAPSARTLHRESAPASAQSHAGGLCGPHDRFCPPDGSRGAVALATIRSPRFEVSGSEGRDRSPPESFAHRGRRHVCSAIEAGAAPA